MDVVEATQSRAVQDTELKRGPTPKEPADIETAARAFEGYLVGAMLRVGSRPIGGEGPLDGGAGGRMYKELFFEEMARLAAEGPGFGISTLLEGGNVNGDTGAGQGKDPR